jgi:hypothetical protein
VVLKVQEWINSLMEAPPSAILMRNEFIVALRVLMEFSYTPKCQFATEDNGSGEGDPMEVDGGGPFSNPFLVPGAQLVSDNGGFIILGNPGIGKRHILSLVTEDPPHSYLGKSSLLQVTLVQRLQAGLPTIYQSVKRHLFFFSKDGVFKCDFTLGSIDEYEFMTFVPKSTWCLVDSNRDLISVPVFITSLGLFIVQAASPRFHRVDWVDKAARPVMRFFMKPWELSELFVG